MSRTKKYLLATVAVTAVATFAFAQSPFCSSPNVAIPDNTPAGITNDIVVSGSFALTDLNVSINTNHTWPGDLIYTVQKTAGPGSPLGPVTIIDRPGLPASTFGCSNDNINSTIDDGQPAAETTCNASPPAIGPGPAGPNNSINTVFAGVDVNGTWRITVSDNAGGDTGTLVQWCLVTTPTPVELMDFSIE
jgi:trimeric autotransporter adhesin